MTLNGRIFGAEKIQYDFVKVVPPGGLQIVIYIE